MAAEGEPDIQALMERLELLEQRLGRLEDANSTAPVTPASSPVAAGGDVAAENMQAVLDSLAALEERLTALETNAVLSEPQTIVRQVQVYVDENGNQYDQPVEGAEAVTTYRRERVYRRQSINEAIEEALVADREARIQVGERNVTTVQGAVQTDGPSGQADGHVFGLTAADVTIEADSPALYSTFFADIVGIGGSPPDQEIPAINLLNGQTARLSNNRLSLREAWVKTELLNQRLGVTVGRVDLTNYFDANSIANDEDTQFISDPLVNNPVLGLTENGLGIVTEYDPKGRIKFRLGVQQSNSQATSLSTSLFTLGEIEYVATPFSLPEGHYRVWFRTDDSSGNSKSAFGLSIDQQLTPYVTLFGRYGNGSVAAAGSDMNFFSAGVGFKGPMAFNPLDVWGIGYSRTDIEENGPDENIVEGFYNLHLTENLSLSGLLQYVLESQGAGDYVLPGLRLELDF